MLAALALGFVRSVVRRPLAPRLVTTFACVAAFAPLALSAVAFSKLVFGAAGEASSNSVVLVDTLYSWVGAGVGSAAFSADMAFRFDALSAVLCLVVTLTSFLVHVYSVGYLDRDRSEDGGAARYFCYLSLLTASMLVLLLADNLLLFFLGWQGVGVCSFLLISFWYGDAGNALAGGRAFVVNRLGDAGFAVGTLLLFWSLARAGTPAVSFRGIEAGFEALVGATVAPPGWSGLGAVSLPTLIGLCFLVAIVVKSAQIPVHVWLPASAVGPLPAAASIYVGSGTVAAVYLIARLAFVYQAAPGAAAAMAWIGVATALLAGSLACVEKDVRRLLSYAATSQAGLMLLAAGAGAPGLAIFHLTLNTFFMTLFFLATGALIVALNGECALGNMGGLRTRLPRTWWMVGISVLTLTGLPPLSAFFSTEEIHRAVFFAAVPAPRHRRRRRRIRAAARTAD
jgi:NADH-quinone oxidoreductase subunit L